MYHPLHLLHPVRAVDLPLARYRAGRVDKLLEAEETLARGVEELGVFALERKRTSAGCTMRRMVYDRGVHEAV
jgi:hypothetical protein